MKRLWQYFYDSDAFWFMLFVFGMGLLSGVAALLLATAGVLVVEYIEWFHQLIRG